jgi:redox-sensitive bicupin YhaK (pirin superfamily)
VLNLRSRKDFLKSMILSTSVLGLSFLFFKIFKSNDKEKQSMELSPIKSITPMGFQWETEDPFLFCVHHEDYYPKGNASLGPNVSLAGREIGQDFKVKDGFRMYHGKEIPGFPSHPHRGFETVTIVRSGFIDHSDSMGAIGRYSSGDVQWMTAGSGVQHSEMFPLLSSDQENKLELFQIWLNLPKKNKLVKPHFTMLWNESIPKLQLSDQNKKKINIEVIAGKMNNITPPSPPPDSWASDMENSVAIWIISMEAGASWILPASEKNINRNLYFYKGKELKVADQDILAYHKLTIESDKNILLENPSKEEISLLLLQARPITEPVVQYGPFVMNTREEIEATFRDFQKTQFGGWPYSTSEPVHGKDKGRFAKHADGKEDLPPA